MKYVIAVSGGIDSVVLLHQLMNKELFRFEDAEFVVAHFDHGVRDNSADDAVFVRELTQKHKIPYELGVVKLGTGVSKRRHVMHAIHSYEAFKKNIMPKLS